MLNDRQSAVQGYYEGQYQGAETQPQRRKVVEEYVSRFPFLAFRADSWFYPIYRAWRSSNNPKDRALLRAMARGLTSQTSLLGGPVDDEALRRIRLAQAAAALKNAKESRKINHLYRLWFEGKSSCMGSVVPMLR